MNRYLINFRLLVMDLLPTNLRQARQIAWLVAVLARLRGLHSEFIAWGEARKYELKFNGQTIVLQKFLRDRYAAPGIWIENLKTETNNATIGEEHDVGAWAAESYDLQNYVPETYVNSTLNFIVHVPAATAFDSAEMRAVIDRYKLYGTTYEIRTFI